MTLSSLEKTICETKYEVAVFTKLGERNSELLTTIEMDYMDKDNDKIIKSLESLKEYGKAKVKHVCVNSATGILSIDVVL